MNRNGFSDYVESTADSLNSTETFVSSVLNRHSELVAPVVTPRFVPTCDQELMLGLGEIAKKYDVRVHSHLAETIPEVIKDYKLTNSQLAKTILELRSDNCYGKK